MNLNDKSVALVTGGSRGIGKQVCLRLAKDNFTVVVNYRSNADAAADVCRQITHAGGTCWSCQADVTKSEEVQRLFNEISERAGRLDVLVNNAGSTHQALFLLTPPAKFFAILQANLMGTILCSQAALRMMIPQCKGHIVNVSSMSATNAPMGLSAYAASKAAVNALTRSIAREVVHKNIRVNAVAPTHTDTDMLKESANLAAGIYESKTALKRVYTADEVASVIVSLLRPEMNSLIGQVIHLDGGGL